MRAKKAKALRKIAQRLTVGLPKTDYTVIRAGGVIGLSDCERKVYKSLKKNV